MLIQRPDIQRIMKAFLMKIGSIVLAVITLTGCSVKHYSVCMAVGQDAGCSHARYSKKIATEIGTLLAGQPGQEDRTVWILDMRKHAKDVEAQPAEKPVEKKNDNKI